MKMFFISTVLVGLFTSMPVAKARIGETLEECEKRYAHLKAVEITPESYLSPYVIAKSWESGNPDDIVVTCFFSNSRVSSQHVHLTTDNPKTFRCQVIRYGTSSLDIGRFPITTAKARALIQKNFDNKLTVSFPEPEITQEPAVCAEEETWAFLLEAPNKSGYDDEFLIYYERVGRMDYKGNVAAYIATTNGNAIRHTKSQVTIHSKGFRNLWDHLEEEEARRQESAASKELDGF